MHYDAICFVSYHEQAKVILTIWKPLFSHRFYKLTSLILVETSARTMVVTSGVICKNAFAFSLCSHNHMFDESIFSLMPVHVTVGDLVWYKHLDRLFSLTKIMRWAFQEIRPYASGKAKLHNKCIFFMKFKKRSLAKTFKNTSFRLFALQPSTGKNHVEGCSANSRKLVFL